VIALVVILWLTTRMVGLRGYAGRAGLVLAVTGIMMWTQPLQNDLGLGQLNMLVVLAVVVDLSLSDRSRYKGIGIGLATAMKLLPGLFVIYLLLTRRIRAAFVAAGTFAALTAIGWIASPGGSYDYWLRGLGFDSHRVLMAWSPNNIANQSWQGTLTRWLHSDTQSSLAWIVTVAAIAAAGLAVAVMAQRRGEETMAMVVVGLTTLLVSPVTWAHYWLWIGPMMIVLFDLARRASGRAQTILAGLAVVAMLPFVEWPVAMQFVPIGGVTGWAYYVSDQHKWRMLALSDPYVPTALVLFLLAWLYLRRRPALPAVGSPAAPVG
jgi:alpha-1,2-mannosyltransferase